MTMTQIDLTELEVIEASALNSVTPLEAGMVCGLGCFGGHVCGWLCFPVPE